MYYWVLTAHSDWRWVVVIAGFLVVLRAGVATVSRVRWEPADTRLARLFVIAIGIQALLGVMLYVALSPITTVGSSGSAGDWQTSFFVAVHPLAMFSALIFGFLASGIVRRAADASARARRALICYGLAWLLVIAGLPWWRPWIRL